MATPTQIIFKCVNEIFGYEKNARTHSKSQVAEIAASIQEFGWTNPILVDECGEIIAGHGRIAAAESLGMNEVPVIVLTGLNSEQKKAYRLADNKIPLNAGWDDELLSQELSELIDADFDICLTGFSQVEIDDLLVEVGSESEEGDERYTSKIDSPVYEPSEAVPEVSALYDDEKTMQLVESIRLAALPADVEKFLLAAAERHTVFNFNKIADYYSHAPENVQALFEASALVIIDYQQAIEHGFVKMTQRMLEIVHGGEVESDAR
ncbi:transcriptional regulator [Superficieibacter electus]|uniref:Transcriptional regulator n=1 Tax=Superficieibacter electus TaxID=2022662 RepID=A0A2P5GVE7_9ENTR|nr:ParB/Srx family N-terminal domain-containing protein [Superficieibacter electus]POP42341.1 transcriptional regulator [Superficieibacter electus]POP50529.1 transcriptional regulator [Superficieibacter electus]